MHHKKRFLPYDWATSVACYDQPYLVSTEDFYNSLTQTHISDKGYRFAKNVWNTFEMKTMKDYLEMYCLTGSKNIRKLFVKI